MRRTLIPVAATLASGLTLLGCGPKDGPHGTYVPTTPTQSLPQREQVTQTVRYLPDCEDEQTTPCVTYDEGEWREVTGYKPYHFGTLSVCDVEDYPTNTPCVWRKRYANGTWMVYTR